MCATKSCLLNALLEIIKNLFLVGQFRNKLGCNQTSGVAAMRHPLYYTSCNAKNIVSRHILHSLLMGYQIRFEPVLADSEFRLAKLYCSFKTNVGATGTRNDLSKISQILFVIPLMSKCRNTNKTIDMANTIISFSSNEYAKLQSAGNAKTQVLGYERKR